MKAEGVYMNSKSGKSQRIRHNYTKIYLLTAALVLIGGIVGGLLLLHFSNIQAPPPAATTEDGTQSAAETGEETTAPAATSQPAASTTAAAEASPTDEPIDTSKVVRFSMSDDDFKILSPLSLINLEHQAQAEAKTVDIKETLAGTGKTLSQLEWSMFLNKDALNALVELNAALIGQYPNYQLLLLSGYTADLNKTSCKSADLEQPLCDEHITGFAFDCRYAVKTGDKTVGVQIFADEAKQQTAFLLAEGAKLGLIQSKANLEGHVQNDLRHFRYVGTPHAQYIHEHKITIEDYLNEIKKYNYNNRMTLTDADGAAYELYYVAVRAGGTEVPVPKDTENYTIWSDNVGGYIVTIMTSPAAPAEPAE